ncbi:GOLPH3/VPS74 family protein [Pseudidiomarina homiensis]|uniref:GOLPH3/VPS74 family protein n=1 Tax=Pseudidiomarina homiensis TaxID=364198 RepID=UPI00215AE520|nr:GPP34 family phosphoprotein [Pseudidiomarina homiensis]
MEIKLYEGLMLLALNDEKGTNEGHYIEYTGAAAILAELLLSQRIQVNKDNKDKVDVLDDSPTGDPIMDEALDKMANKKKPDTLKNWVMALAQISKLKHKIAEQLVADGIIKADEKKVLWLFTQKIYPEVNPEPEKHLKREMRRLVLDKPLEIHPKIALMVALAKSAYVLDQVFSKEELKKHKQLIEQIAKGEELGTIATDVIDGVQAAVMVATMMPAMMAAVTASTTACTTTTTSC